jgi:hypothetical protein
MIETIELKSNEFWGNRSGMIHPTRGPIFKLRRATVKTSGNAGPTGWKLKKAPRRYSNARLRKKGIL